MSDETPFRSRSPLDPLTPSGKKSRGRIPHSAPPPGIFGTDVDTLGPPNARSSPPSGWLHAIAIRSEKGGTVHLFTETDGEDVLLVSERDKDHADASAGAGGVQLSRREFLALGLLLGDASAPGQRTTTGPDSTGVVHTTTPSASRRKSGRPRMSRAKARQLLLRRMQRLSGTRDPLEPLTNVALARVNPKCSEDTISDLLKRAEWERDDLDVEWARRGRKKPE